MVRIARAYNKKQSDKDKEEFLEKMLLLRG